jgi:hypothetical protein
MPSCRIWAWNRSSGVGAAGSGSRWWCQITSRGIGAAARILVSMRLGVARLIAIWSRCPAKRLLASNAVRYASCRISAS